MKDQPLITVVLATYNGCKYLTEQLESIYNQTHKNIEVIVCDDKSTDSTSEILQSFAKSHNLKYFINENRIGVINNFAKAMKYASGQYVALSDQDDIWLPEKLKVSLLGIQELEKKFGNAHPALIYTDLKVVNETLGCINKSYWAYMQLNPQNNTLNRILVENVATGCTILTNRPNIKLALPIPESALMHDIWLLLTASCFGNIKFINQPTVLYRQHVNNVIGARQMDVVSKIISGLNKIKESRFSLLEAEIRQATAFYEQYNLALQSKVQEKKILEDFISLKTQSAFLKRYLIFKHKFFGSTFRKALSILLRA